MRAGAVELTYTELDDRVNHLARELIARGVGPESNVAVFMSRSVDMLIAVYAVLAAGGAYVPLDPEHPVDRTEYVLQAAAPVLVLTTVGERSTVSDSIPTVLVDDIDLSTHAGTAITDATAYHRCVRRTPPT